MKSQIPQYIIDTINDMAKYSNKLVILNTRLEHWLESKGFTESGSAYEYLSQIGQIDYRGYDISDPQGFVDSIQLELEQ